MYMYGYMKKIDNNLTNESEKLASLSLVATQSRIHHFVENHQRPSSTLCDRICLVPYSTAW